MCDTGGFHILNGVLVEYTGPGGQVTVPDGVREIGRRAFHGCPRLILHAPADSCAAHYARGHDLTCAEE